MAPSECLLQLHAVLSLPMRRHSVLVELFSCHPRQEQQTPNPLSGSAANLTLCGQRAKTSPTALARTASISPVSMTACPENKVEQGQPRKNAASASMRAKLSAARHMSSARTRYVSDQRCKPCAPRSATPSLHACISCSMHTHMQLCCTIGSMSAQRSVGGTASTSSLGAKSWNLLSLFTVGGVCHVRS